ncbi:uncharacterized protein Z519_09988 [Cladophialophora bantiana CBS 173.52]|uniref:Uncharacterized protein n=1 Tax=Cladophialophora bantiana (strain ATCC 10958 / CBS 173.52 / CDC B-1940 / NIH 8579) TaxID=1442370 RepID=A0A0D2EGF8_CLAB1|nr:uncharacterized protein Z519_09988 [Cladophialophora bantiana CBS 173.52]KIW89136.1 hypothetical protein Z519_09988 [Cladophialophora bantiana CBS 173.52]
MSAVRYTNGYGAPLSPQAPGQLYSWAYELLELVAKVEEVMWNADEVDVAFEDFPEAVFFLPLKKVIDQCTKVVERIWPLMTDWRPTGGSELVEQRHLTQSFVFLGDVTCKLNNPN